MAAERRPKPPNPFVGPRPFEREDENRFFGRRREIRDLASLVVAHRVVLLYSPSGAGKSSLLNAGVLPLLEEKGFEVLPPARVGTFPPGVEDAEGVNLFAATVVAQIGGTDALSGSADGSLAGFLRGRKRRLDDEGDPAPIVLVLDQFEELFTGHLQYWQQREGLFEQLRDALLADPGFRVVLVLREEYLAELEPFAAILPGNMQTRFRLDRLDFDCAVAAIKGPLEGTGRSFDDDVAEDLVRGLLVVRAEIRPGVTEDVPGEFVEPVQLQVVAEQLWDGLPADVELIEGRHVQEFADLDAVLGRFYEQGVTAASRASGVKQPDLRDWIHRALITPGGTRGTAYRGETETAGMKNGAVEALEDRRVVRAEQRAGARWYELTHDRLIAPIQASNRRYFSARRRRRTWLWAIAGILLLPGAAGAIGASIGFGSAPGHALVNLRLTPSRVGFGRVYDPFLRPHQTLTLFSGSNAARVRFVTTGDWHDFFVDTGTCLSTLPANGFCTIRVVFTPTAVGKRVAYLEALSGDSDEGLRSVLTGEVFALCSRFRLPVKTLSDREAAAVDLVPHGTARIEGLVRFPAPADLTPETPRIQTAEFRTFTIDAKIVAMRTEPNGEIRLVLKDPLSSTQMDASLPSGGCALGAPKRLQLAMRAARSKLLRRCGPAPPNYFVALNGRALVTGVAFFDRIHGQRGVAPNGIELEPVLDLKIKSCRPVVQGVFKTNGKFAVAKVQG